MTTKRYSETERLGINEVEKIFIKNFKWIFREQPIVDMGIDAHIEFVKENTPTGKLFGVQIKTGESHFYEAKEHYTFYLDETHFDYWTNHSLPVLLVGHLPEKETTIWQHVTKTNVEKTKRGWKIDIPKSQELTKSHSIYQITDIIETKSLDGKIAKLFFDKELMQFLKDGGKINLYTEEWHNKSLGRGPFKIILIKDKREEIVREWNLFYTYGLEDLFEKLFPWASFENDKEFYESNFHKSVFDVYSQGWLYEHKIFPYRVLAAEVGLYRIDLKLNKFGKAFLELEDYLK